MSRTLAIGDIHGCLTALDTVLGFAAVSPRDHVVFLGDYVDRGPDSKGTLDRLIGLRRRGQVICLRGNHEIMMAAAREGWNEYRFWLECGGREAIESYGGPDGVATMDDIADSHWHFITRLCDDWYETDSHIFVHANLNPDLPLEQQPSDWLHWKPLMSFRHRPHNSGKTMICGHSEQRDGVPLKLDGAIGIDTWAYGEGWLTCLDVDSGEYWQGNELGQTRAGRV